MRSSLGARVLAVALLSSCSRCTPATPAALPAPLPREAARPHPGCQPKGPVLSKFVPDLHTENIPGLLANLADSPINVVSTTIAWRIAEPTPGKIDLERYYPAFDELAKRGFCLIVFLDSSGRGLLDEQRAVTKTPAYPGWLLEALPEALARDFFGEQSPNLDYFEPRHQELLTRFYEQALAQLQTRYRASLFGAAPGIMGELEIKYYQGGYRWNSYSPAAQAEFGRFLSRKGHPPAKLPVTAYGNPLIGGTPHVEPLLPELMEFREAGVRDYACRLTDLIRKAGLPAIGYFAQPLSGHDGIYGTGTIERCAPCFDVVSVDYNFFNGYGVERRPDVPPALVDFTLGLGFPKVIAGLYVERFRGPSGELDESILPVLKQSIDDLPQDPRLIGLDVGGLTPAEFPLLKKHQLQLPPRSTAAKKDKPYQVGVLASRTNFLVWHGEWSNDRQLLQDDLLGTYKLLKEDSSLEVHLLAESTIRGTPDALRRLDLVVLPLVTAVDDTVRSALLEYWKAGGRLAQDLRFDSFNPDGSIRQSEFNAVFGIGGISWEHRSLDGMYKGRAIHLPKQERKETSFSRMAPAAGYTLRFEDPANPGTGLIVRGPRTLVFGYAAAIPEGDTDLSAWRQLYLSEIRDLLEEGRTAPEQHPVSDSGTR